MVDCYYSGTRMSPENCGAGRGEGLPGGSADELKNSIEKLSQLDIEFLLPGHMDIVKGIEKVKQNFNFIREYVFKWL